MIKKLKRKFIILATVSMFVLMMGLVGIMNIFNYTSVVADTDAILDVLTQPNAPFFGSHTPPAEPNRNIDDYLPRGMSPEVPYESRYFAAIVSRDGELIESDISKIISVDSESVEEYVSEAVNSAKDRGFIGQFRYAKIENDRTMRILFLDCGRKLDTFYNFMWISVSIGLLGCIIIFVVFLSAAGRIVHPIAESYKKQKRFITDAGHEIKTPLTIISANLDLLEDDFGANESFSDIRQQTKRLSQLTGDLVYLSKMEESAHTLQKVEFPVSDLVSETAAQFHALALSQKKEYLVRVVPSLTMNGAPDAIRQLVSILIENAMKYSPEGGIITLDLTAEKKTLLLSVVNTTKEPLTQDTLSHLFERFYRTDSSRNSETGGHGIGLSIAQAITEAHGGKITASTQNGLDFCIEVSLPL